MRSMRHFAAALAGGLLTAGLVASAADVDVQSNIPGVEWDELTKAVRAIEAAGKADEAMAAYARGCTVNRQSVKLQDTYLRRMLKFGRPDVAYYPAQELTKLDPKNGIAWGVVAYVLAKRGQYAAALPGAVRAADLEKDNPSICQNAAQLLAWYEGGKRPAVDAETDGTLKKLKSSAYSGRTFAEAYRKAKESYAKLADEKEAKKKEAQTADAEAKKLETKYKQLSDSLKARGRSYESDQNRLDRARRDLARVEDQIARAGDYRTRQSYEQRRDSLIRQIRSTEDSIRKEVSEGRKIRKERDDVEKEYKSKRDQASRLLRQASAVEDGVPDNFGWLPPAVDGVVTPDATVATAKPTSGGTTPAPSKRSYLVPDKPDPKASEPARPPLAERVAEAEAADKLGLAKICLGSKTDEMRATAKKLLQEILTSYPKTQAAREAQELIKKLP